VEGFKSRSLVKLTIIHFVSGLVFFEKRRLKSGFDLAGRIEEIP
jgi:hypothetical protein